MYACCTVRAVLTSIFNPINEQIKDKLFETLQRLLALLIAYGSSSGFVNGPSF